ncbi:Rapid ALkalinization Factor [Fagus crenata]
MGGNEKRSLCMGILVILLLFNRATSLTFNSTTYHCNASVHECLVMDGIDSEFLMDSETSKMLAGESTSFSPGRNADDYPDTEAIVCGRGRPYTPCVPNKNHPPQKDCTGLYCRTQG